MYMYIKWREKKTQSNLSADCDSDMQFALPYTVYPRLNAPGSVTFCKTSAKKTFHIILSISAWKKINFGA